MSNDTTLVPNWARNLPTVIQRECPQFVRTLERETIMQAKRIQELEKNIRDIASDCENVARDEIVSYAEKRAWASVARRLHALARSQS